MELPRMRWAVGFALKHNRRLIDVLNMSQEEMSIYAAYELTQDADWVAAYQQAKERELQLSLSPNDRAKYIRINQQRSKGR